MIPAIAAWLAKPVVKYSLIALAVFILIGGTLLIVRNIYSKGEKAGTVGVTSAVQTETIRKVDDARKAKEKADDEVRSTPYEERVDGLR
ncbi:hypothetical protein [Reyranella sp.]|uniref:hypothetical protein n=1 Tax=Reyranella sp. TaxID=1929291 RepID=UPI0012042FFD|nr:hypothetical protein [Reyranella sp.]TAJ89748.1 MAG: hypothetical protein EPO50_05115 [Reyranella sp.]